jgi:hypothetical protein
MSGYSSATCNMGLKGDCTCREDCILRLFSRDVVYVTSGLFNDTAPMNKN